MWLPQLTDRPGPKYLRIADALAEDIYAGRLQPGARLPTHRELAWRLDVTVGTVSRAYAEAEHRGLLVGEVGRGSFVRPGARSQNTIAMPDSAEPSMIELGINRPPTSVVAGEMAKALADLAEEPKLAELMNYIAHTGHWSHRAAGAEWVARRGLRVGPEQVLVTSGAQHGIIAALMAFADAGDTILVEELTWSGTRAIASLLRLGLKPVAMDAGGLIPEALEAACRATGARLLYTTPSVQNPTASILSDERRRAVAEIARLYGVTIIEDDVYGFLDAGGPPALASYAPERTIYVTATSKSLAPTLRIGFAAMPMDRVGRFASAARASNWMAPPLMAEIVRRWIADGTADRVVDTVRLEAAARQRLARRMLAGFEFKGSPSAFHLWLGLPEPWRAQDVVSAARRRGISITPTELFVPGRSETPHAIRLALTAPETHGVLENGLSQLRDVLAGVPDLPLAVA